MEYETCAQECGCDEGFYDAMESRLMQMTFMAHKAVLFEKIRERIEKEEGEKLDRIAELLVEASQKGQQSDIESAKQSDELRRKLKETYEE